MTDKADEHDITLTGFQIFTINNLYNKLLTDSDIEQFELLSIIEGLTLIDKRKQ